MLLLETLKWFPLPDPIKLLGPETDCPGSDPETQQLHPTDSKVLSSFPSYKLCLVSLSGLLLFPQESPLTLTKLLGSSCYIAKISTTNPEFFSHVPSMSTPLEYCLVPHYKQHLMHCPEYSRYFNSIALYTVGT